MLLDEVLVGSFAGQQLEQKDSIAVDVGLMRERPSWIAAFRGAVEEGGGAWLVGGVGVSEGGEAVVGEAGLKVGPE